MTYPTGTTPPNYPAAPQYPQYPQYPTYPQYMQAPPMWMPPVQAPPPPLRPLPEPPHGLAPDRYARIIGIVVVVVVAVAVVLASVAPFLVNHSSSAVPSNWAKIYDGQPSSGDGYWQLNDGCTTTSQGLLATQDANSTNAPECNFAPSQARDLTSQGFYFEAVTAPPADVADEEDPVMAFGVSGNVLAIFFGQDGTFTLCTDPCEPNSTGVYTAGAAGSWHTNGYTQNTIALLYTPTSQQVTAYVNGQEVSTVAFSAPPASRLLLSAASSDAGSTDALFTHVRIFTGSLTA